MRVPKFIFKKPIYKSLFLLKIFLKLLSPLFKVYLNLFMCLSDGSRIKSPRKIQNWLRFSVATLFRFVARFARVRIEDSSQNRSKTLVGKLRSTAFKELPSSLLFLHNSKNKNRKNLKFDFSALPQLTTSRPPFPPPQLRTHFHERCAMC